MVEQRCRRLRKLPYLLVRRDRKTRHQRLAGLPVANHEPLHLGAVPRDEIPDER